MPPKKNKPAPSRRGPFIDAAQNVVRWFFRINALVFLKVRVYGLEKVPPNGPMLLLANHQSNLDPIVMGVICPHPINYLAKKSLFVFKPLGWFLSWNDCIPIERESNAIGGIKETLKRLKRKEWVLIFPEGSRSPDGKLLPVKQGFCTMARRTKSPILPVAIEGTHEAYPKNAIAPGFGNVHVVVGDAISFEQYQNISDDQLAAMVEQAIAELFDDAKMRRRLTTR